MPKRLRSRQGFRHICASSDKRTPGRADYPCRDRDPGPADPCAPSCCCSRPRPLFLVLVWCGGYHDRAGDHTLVGRLPPIHPRRVVVWFGVVRPDDLAPPLVAMASATPDPHGGVLRPDDYRLLCRERQESPGMAIPAAKLLSGFCQ